MEAACRAMGLQCSTCLIRCQLSHSSMHASSLFQCNARSYEQIGADVRMMTATCESCQEHMHDRTDQQQSHDHSLYTVWIEAIAHRKMGAQDCSREVELAGSHRVAAAIHQLLQWGWRMAAGRSQQLWQGGLFCSNTCVRIEQLYMACIWQRSSMHIDI